MSESELFPVICTADIPTPVSSILSNQLLLSPRTKTKPLTQKKQKDVETFLNDAYTGSEQLVPGTPPSLVILTITNTSDEGSDALSSSASQPPLQPFTSPFFGQSVEEAAQHTVFRNASFFAVLDQRSSRDSTALLAACDPNGSVHTVRVTFPEVHRTLISLVIGSIRFGEIQSIAANQGNGGVYGAPAPGLGPQQGGPAPRMKLGT
jgi:hypothetical protein